MTGLIRVRDKVTELAGTSSQGATRRVAARCPAKHLDSATTSTDGKRALVRLLAELLVEDYLAEREHYQKAGSSTDTVPADCCEKQFE